MSKRETGWYWVKVSPHSKWKSSHFDGETFALNGFKYIEQSLHAIHETRIPEPDEQSQFEKLSTTFITTPADNNNQH